MMLSFETAVVTAAVIGLTACQSHQADPATTDSTGAASDHVDNRCTLGTPPTVLKRDGSALLQYWTLTETDILSSAVLPEDSALAEYRRVIDLAGADLARPVADRPQPGNESERLLWVREEQNVEVAFSGRGGDIRTVRCLDALLFASQNARYSQITHPTEFIASVLRMRVDDQDVLKVYFAAGGMMFPPKGFNGFDEIEQDLAAGWEFWTVLHNHTVQRNKGEPALGVPAPSTSDVDLFRHLAKEMGLQNAWVTNGFFTVEIPASAFEHYLGRD